MPDHATTAPERARHVYQANANQGIEGFQPDASDKAIQAKYIAGTATLADLLAHAQKFATESHTRYSA